MIILKRDIMWLYIAGFVLLYLIYLLIVYIFGMNYITKSIQPDIIDAKERDLFAPSVFPASPFGQGIRQTYSFWIYLKNLNYRYGQNKYVFTKQIPGADIPTVEIYIDTRSADLMLNVLNQNNVSTPQTVKIGTIPLKKWHQISIIQEANVLDVFLNGRVVYTSGRGNPVVSTHGEEVIMSKLGGWNGFRSKFIYSNFNQNMQNLRGTLEEGPLQMSTMNPLFYIYAIIGYINAFNNFLLAMLLPDPKAAAQNALNDLNKSKDKEAEEKEESNCPDVSKETETPTN